MTPERKLERTARAEIKALGAGRALLLKFKAPGRRNVPDDILLLPDGRTVFIEFKDPDKDPTAPQEREHQRYRRLGYPVFVVKTYETWALLKESYGLHK
jgi:hypothetical protein